MPILTPIRGRQINRASQQAQGLVAFWPFNEGTGGVARDLSGNENHGTRNGTGTSIWVPGDRGWSQDFNNSDDYISVSDNNILDFGTNDLTVMARIKSASSALHNPIVAKRNWTGIGQWMFYTASLNGRLRVAAEGSYATANTMIAGDDQWHDCVFCRRSDDLQFFLDGHGDGSTFSFFSGMTLDNTSELAIGDSDLSSARYFDGLIGEVRVYNRALSASQIQYLYRDPNEIFRRTSVSVLVSGAAGTVVPALDVGMLTGGLQPLSGGLE